MARKKQSKKEYFQTVLNDMEEVKASEMRELTNLDYKIKCKFKSKKQKEMSDTIRNNRITFVTGSPGTGKSFVALKTALELLKSKKEKIGKVLLSTPIVEVSPKSLGALPGTIEEKTNKYFEHFYDNIDKIVDKNVSKFLKNSGLIEDKIINFVRGATFGEIDENGNPIGSFCILDEAQNTTPMELKTYISRLGENSKMVILGDVEQCDLKLKKGEKNGLEDAINRLEGLENVGFIHFEDDDIVRDKFLIEVMKRYK